ncbi:hypothetical protein [Streptomyces sp. NPDC048623]|uniref:hypothetical protein n=1 Tax=Streptomyces sp. NPDC048623 TaxID=3155761 RepID=UPI00341E28C2
MDELPELTIASGDWMLSVPPPAVPVPAAHVMDLHGRAAMASDPGVGVLHDLRIVGDRDRDFVHVVTELDFWRSQYDAARPLNPRRLPIEDVYVEHRLPYEPPSPGATPPPPPPTSNPSALLRRLAPRPDLPGGRTPVPARTAGHIYGRRIIQATPLGFAWDLRAVSEPYDDKALGIVVRLTSVPEFYRWLLTGSDPNYQPVSLHLLWTE